MYLENAQGATYFLNLQEKINIDNINLLAKMKKNWRLWYNQYIQDIGMELFKENGDMLIMRRKRQLMEWIELPNQEGIKTLGAKEIYKYFGILEANTIKQVKTKEKDKINSISG